MKTFASLFTGFGGADIGAMAAGLTPVWGIEFDQKIAAIANANLGEHVQVADILDCDPATYPAVDVLHASPPCPSFSVAKNNGKETAHDIAMARKVAEFVTVIAPRIFTLENVWGYRNSWSWAIIRDTLNDAGYWLDIAHVNAADFGVPQTRKRMIARAVKGAFVPYLPPAERWIGWLEAIADLVDDLPETQFADWQLKRLPEELRTSLFTNSATEYGDGFRDENNPAFCTTTQHVGRARAFLLGKNNNKFGKGVRRWSEQAQTIGANEHGSKSFVVDCQNAGNPSTEGDRGMTVRGDREPVFTLTASMGVKRPTQAHCGGRVVAMTPRCLARFQSFPDWYELPKSRTLAAKGIGNAVPPLLMEKIYRQLLEY